MAEEEEWSEVTVDANGNVWSGDDLIVFEDSGDIKSVGAPPAGITKGEIATVDRSGNYSFSQGDGMYGEDGFSTGSMPGAGGDIEVALSIWEKLKDVSWGDAFKGIGKAILRSAPSIIALWSAYKDPVAKAQAGALGAQADASKAMVDAWKEDRGQSKEARGSLYNALQGRMSQGAPPALMPGKVAYANPYQNVVKIGRGESGSGSPESGPGATLRDAIRSEFTDRHPNAPPQQFIQQHPDRFARPGGPSTWEGQGGPSPSFDQTGRIGTESSDPYNMGGGNGVKNAWDDTKAAAMTAGFAAAQAERTESPDPYNLAGPGDSSQVDQSRRGRRDRWNTRPPTGTRRDTGNLSLYDAQAQIAEAMRTRERPPLPDPTPDEWMRLLDNPHLMEMFKTKGVIL